MENSEQEEQDERQPEWKSTNQYLLHTSCRSWLTHQGALTMGYRLQAGWVPGSPAVLPGSPGFPCQDKQAEKWYTDTLIHWHILTLISYTMREFWWEKSRKKNYHEVNGRKWIQTWLPSLAVMSAMLFLRAWWTVKAALVAPPATPTMDWNDRWKEYV